MAAATAQGPVIAAGRSEPLIRYTLAGGCIGVEDAGSYLRTLADSAVWLGVAPLPVRLLWRIGAHHTASRVQRWWARSVSQRLNVQIDWHDLDQIAPREAYVVMPLHEGLADVLAVLQLPLRLRFVVRDEFVDWPLLGGYLRDSRQITIRPEDGTRAYRTMLPAAGKVFAEGESLVVFPQGSILGIETVFLPGAFGVARLPAPYPPYCHHRKPPCVGVSIQSPPSAGRADERPSAAADHRTGGPRAGHRRVAAGRAAPAQGHGPGRCDGTAAPVQTSAGWLLGRVRLRDRPCLPGPRRGHCRASRRAGEKQGALNEVPMCWDPGSRKTASLQVPASATTSVLLIGNAIVSSAHVFPQGLERPDGMCAPLLTVHYPYPAATKVGLEHAVSASNAARSSHQMRNREVPADIIVIVVWFVAPISVSDITDGNRNVLYRTLGC